MIKTYQYASLSAHEKRHLTERTQMSDCSPIVEKMLADIKARGAAAVWEYAQKFDGYRHQQPYVDEKSIRNAQQEISKPLQESLQQAYQNIYSFHELQKDSLHSPHSLQQRETTIRGSVLGYRVQTIDSAAAYIPGGSALYPSTILMAGIPAQIAGVSNMMLITSSNADGVVHPVLRYCAKLVGIEKILQIGGVQGVASAVYGIFGQPIDLLVGPGNAYVTYAKSLLAQSERIKIDFPAGPSEVLIIADATADAEFVAADLLAQAEHGEDSVCVLLAQNESVVASVTQAMEKLLQHGRYDRRRKLIEASLKGHGFALVAPQLQQLIDFSNDFAPEHLSLCVEKPTEVFAKIRNAGSVFLGAQTPVAMGDYFSGTNHILPTSGYARCYSGLGVDTYLRKMSYQIASSESLALAEQPILAISEVEGLDAGHGYSVSVRAQKLQPRRAPALKGKPEPELARG